MTRRTKRLLWGMCVVLLLCMIVLVIAHFFDFVILRFEIDLNSGRHRRRWVCLGMTPSSRIIETPFSELVEHLSLTTEDADEEWGLISAQHYSLWHRGSSTGKYSNAYVACKWFVQALEIYEYNVRPLTDKQRKEKAAAMLSAIREKDFALAMHIVQEMSEGKLKE